MLATYSAKFIIGVILLWLGLCTNQSIYAQNLVKDPGIDSVNCSHFQNNNIPDDHWADPIDSPCFFGALISGVNNRSSCIGTDKLKYWSSYKIEGKNYLANANGLRYNYDYRSISLDSCKPDFLVHIPILFRDYMFEEKCALDSAYTPVFGELYRNKIIPSANYYVSFFVKPKAYFKKDEYYGKNILYDYSFISTSSYGLKFLDHAPDTNLDARLTRNYVDGQYDIKNTNGYLEDSIVFKIKGNYLATGNEHFLAVGCFDMPQNLPYTYVDSYYVDKRYANDSLIFIDTVYYDPDYRKVLGG